MLTLFNLKSPLRNAIILYIILAITIFTFKPKLIQNNDNKYLISIIIIIISVISYYIFAILNSFLS
jgi:hypothetical protein